MADICEHTGLAKEGCGHCRGLDSSPSRPSRTDAWEAEFDGHCIGECDSPIRRGEVIVRAGDWGYRHEEC